MTFGGGNYGFGTMFKIKPDGTGILNCWILMAAQADLIPRDLLYLTEPFYME
jgi:hypothetical protein